MGEVILIDKLFLVHGMARACFLYQLPFLLFIVRWSFQIQHAIRGKNMHCQKLSLDPCFVVVKGPP